MKIIYVYLFIFTNVFMATDLAYAESTAQKTIDWMRLRSDQGNYYLVKDGGWGGVPECPGAKYAYIKANINPYADQLLSAALAAKLSNTPVSLWGTCEGTQYFRITSINIH
ncbi:MAG: hypothetical protein JKY45_02460 [Emcibacter sp.]|nr:hypothetical protein [Emcibacter sp.]